MTGSGEKLDTDRQIGQPPCCGLCQEPFSQEQWLCPSLLMTSRKVAMHGDHPQEPYVGCMGTGMENICVMLVGFSPA
jgi:hypothetical protein